MKTNNQTQNVSSLTFGKVTHGMLKKVKHFLAITFYLITSTTLLYAQASLAAEDMVEDITVTTKYGEQKTYTLIRDSQTPEQWYYMPNGVRVAEEVNVNGKVGPKMTILKYQYKDKITKETKEGAVLSATFTMAMESEVVDEVKTKLVAKVRKLQNSKDAYWKKYQRKLGKAEIRLAGLPLESSKIQFLNGKGDFMGEVDAKTSFDGATTASQEMVMSYNLTALGASVIQGLASGKSGLTLRASVAYKGLTPPCGYTINGKWDNVYKYFEKQTKKEGGVKIWVIKASATDTKQKKRESLEKIQDITVEQIACEGEDKSAGDENLKSLLDKIEGQVFNTEILTQAKELEKLKSMFESTNDEDLKKKLIDKIAGTEKSINFGYQRSVKDIEKRQTGEINYDYSKQQIVTRNTTFGGGLSFSKYKLSEEQLVQDGYVINIDANKDFRSTIFGLPIINPDYGARAITLEIKYKNSDGSTRSEARQWTKNNGWLTPMGKKVSHIQFNLIGEKDQAKLDEPEFDVNLQVVSSIPNGSFNISRKVKMAGDEKFVDAIEMVTDSYIIDGEDLSYFKTSGNPTDLSRAEVLIKNGDVSIKKSIKPYSINGTATAPSPVYLLFPKSETGATGKVTYVTKNGIRKVRDQKIELGENILDDFDWKQSIE
ncbi:hypothetical protein [Spongiivirga citrea]|uniref:Uncharacterized protein n=1 Tax=Spongiivirga citrea TaxID=1481457 RepID=A0A6M0CGG7_9FLAO|nr:hypothetical protein [Spongiivirga citrea]NER16552.1 hypothetical protein [Spongiivirga citrea]